MKTEQNTYRLRRLAVTILLVASFGCLNDPFTGSTIQIDFLGGLEPSAVVRMPDGSRTHYELWAQFGEEGVVSLGSFQVTSEFKVVSYPDVDSQIGDVFNQSFALQASGVRWVTEYSLERAGSMFITAELNGETDISPSGIIIMEGPLAYDGFGVLRGQLTGQYQTTLGETKFPLAEVAVVLAEDRVDL